MVLFKIKATANISRQRAGDQGIENHTKKILHVCCKGEREVWRKKCCGSAMLPLACLLVFQSARSPRLCWFLKADPKHNPSSKQNRKSSFLLKLRWPAHGSYHRERREGSYFVAVLCVPWQPFRSCPLPGALGFEFFWPLPQGMTLILGRAVKGGFCWGNLAASTSMANEKILKAMMLGHCRFSLGLFFVVVVSVEL